MPEDAAIVADHLVKTFSKGTVKALDGLSLSIEAGTVFGLLGPNGAGKTTAVRIFTTILAPDSGSARVFGHDVVSESDTVRRIIGLAGQYATVDENLTGRENLRMIGKLCRLGGAQAAKRADELLEQFDLTAAANRPVKTYSGGMRRRLDLGSALMVAPPVLFLDEPTTGLDPQSRQDLWRVIQELVGGGTTVLLTTQYLEEADILASRIAVVDHGVVIAEGTSAELKAGMGTSVVSFTMADAATAQLAASHLSEFGTPAVIDTVVELTVDDGPKAAADALRILDANALTIAGLNLREPSLDDVFLTLTGHKTDDGADKAPAPVAS